MAFMANCYHHCAAAFFNSLPQSPSQRVFSECIFSILHKICFEDECTLAPFIEGILGVSASKVADVSIAVRIPLIVIPIMIHIMANNRPMRVLGFLSPYPTVVIEMNAHLKEIIVYVSKLLVFDSQDFPFPLASPIENRKSVVTCLAKMTVYGKSKRHFR